MGTWNGSSCDADGGYDTLNRPLRKSYSDGTPTVEFTYDIDQEVSGVQTESKPVGRLVKISNGEGTTVYRFDGLGRVVASQQSASGLGSKAFQYEYMPAGLSKVKYPSGRVVVMGYGSDGRLNSVTEPTGLKPYVKELEYSPFGGVERLVMGNGLVEKWTYSALRGQVRRVALGTAVSENSVGEWLFRYCSGTYLTECASNNGNLKGQTIQPLNAVVAYSYDGLGRVKTWAEAGSVRQTFVYDQFGNRALLSGSANGNYVPSWPRAPEVISDNETQAEAIFEENRVKRATVSAGTEVTYGYNGEGRRVRRTAGGATTYFDAGGNLSLLEAVWYNFPEPVPRKWIELSRELRTGD
jgi:YD repeat-containing protein